MTEAQHVLDRISRERHEQQLDIDGRLHDIEPEHERMRLFEPAPTQLAGQTHLDTDHESEAA